MVVNRRKKVVRYRGSQTHGGGAKKKRRGAGHRGGRGMAGSGKRADTKKPSLWKDDYFGKRGFTSKSRRAEDVVMNLSLLQEMLPALLARKLATKQGDVVSVDLKAVGYTKLLGDGSVQTKLRITVPYASTGAVSKVREAGGEVIALNSAPSNSKE
jgi:large subunit ribosomal protein L15